MSKVTDRRDGPLALRLSEGSIIFRNPIITGGGWGWKNTILIKDMITKPVLILFKDIKEFLPSP